MGPRARDLGKAAGSVARLTGKLALTAMRLSHARRQALGGFRRGLAEQGVPGEAIEELCAAYPAINLLRQLRPPSTGS